MFSSLFIFPGILILKFEWSIKPNDTRTFSCLFCYLHSTKRSLVYTDHMFVVFRAQLRNRVRERQNECAAEPVRVAVSARQSQWYIPNKTPT